MQLLAGLRGLRVVKVHEFVNVIGIVIGALSNWCCCCSLDVRQVYVSPHTAVLVFHDQLCQLCSPNVNCSTCSRPVMGSCIFLLADVCGDVPDDTCCCCHRACCCCCNIGTMVWPMPPSVSANSCCLWSGVTAMLGEVCNVSWRQGKQVHATCSAIMPDMVLRHACVRYHTSPTRCI